MHDFLDVNQDNDWQSQKSNAKVVKLKNRTFFTFYTQIFRFYFVIAISSPKI